MKHLKRLPLPVLILLGIILYIATAIPLGVVVYSFKNSLGLNIFSRSGYHALTTCLKTQYEHERFGQGVW